MQIEAAGGSGKMIREDYSNILKAHVIERVAEGGGRQVILQNGDPNLSHHFGETLVGSERETARPRPTSQK